MSRRRKRQYAIGGNAIAECQRSGQKMRYADLVEDGAIPGLLVHPDWYEPRHPQEQPVSGADATALYRPAPEISPDAANAIAVLTAVWSPAAVNETINRGALSATTYTLTAAGGYSPYTYRFSISGSAQITAEEVQTANTIKLRVGNTDGAYPVTVIGTVIDSLGQQKTTSFAVTETIVNPLPANLALYIASLLPTHWWKTNETSALDTLLDYGSAANLNMPQIGATIDYYSAGGPDTSTQEFFDLYGGTPHGKIAVSPGATSTGSVVFFIRKRASAALPSTAAYWYMDDGTTDLFNAIYLGVGLEGGADAGRLGVIFYSPTGATDFRHVYASDQQFTANDTWQCAVYTFDGVSAPKIYTNGVLGTNAQTTGGGSPPAATRWMASNSFPRCVLYTRQYNAPAGTLNSKVSNPFIINGVVLTQAQITNIMSYLPTP